MPQALTIQITLVQPWDMRFFYTDDWKPSFSHTNHGYLALGSIMPFTGSQVQIQCWFPRVTLLEDPRLWLCSPSLLLLVHSVRTKGSSLLGSLLRISSCPIACFGNSTPTFKDFSKKIPRLFCLPFYRSISVLGGELITEIAIPQRRHPMVRHQQSTLWGRGMSKRKLEQDRASRGEEGWRKRLTEWFW